MKYLRTYNEEWNPFKSKEEKEKEGQEEENIRQEVIRQQKEEDFLLQKHQEIELKRRKNYQKVLDNLNDNLKDNDLKIYYEFAGKDVRFYSKITDKIPREGSLSDMEKYIEKIKNVFSIFGEDIKYRFFSPEDSHSVRCYINVVILDSWIDKNIDSFDLGLL